MRTKLLSIVMILLVAMLSLVAVSCGGDIENTKIETQGMLVENGVYKVTVPNSTESYDILSKITFNKNAEYELSVNKDFSSKLDSGVVSLTAGDNIYYLRVTDGDYNSVYTFNVYRKKMVTVTYNPNGGSMSNTTTTVEEGTTISAPAATKVGYSLSWDYDFTKPVSSDVTINAVWTANTCQIFANIDGEIVTYDVAFGTVPSNVIAPNKVGYVFTGWKYGETSFDTTKPFDYNESSIEIVATFEPVEFKVQYVIDAEFVTNDSNVKTFTIVVADGEVFEISLLAPVHSLDNYIFDGWYTEADLINKVESIDLSVVERIGDSHVLVLHPKWKINSNITFDANGGTCDAESNVYSVGEAYELPVPQKENYVFDGWFNGEQKIVNSGVWALANDAVLVAKWSPRQNEIEYILGFEGAVNNADNPNSFDIEDDSIELLAPTYDANHKFVGWFTSANFTDDTRITHITSDMVGQSITLYAKWEKVINIELDVAGGECETDSMQLQIGDTYTLPTPTRDKYIFVGWFNGTTPVNTSGNWLYDENTVLVAKWTPKEYKVSYVLDGGVNNEGNVEIFTIETEADLLEIKAPSKEFHKFLGWYLDTDYTAQIERIDPAVHGSITLYAKWEAIKVTITYDAAEGDVSKENETLNLGDNYILPVPVRHGFKFEGWYMDGVLVENSGRLTDENVTTMNLVAKWTMETYTITYNLDNGTVEGLKTEYNVLTDDFTLPTPIRSGYIFAGWSLNGGTANASVVITKGSVGDLSYKAVWIAEKDSNGLIYSITDNKLVIVGIDREINDSIISGIKFPSKYEGYEVVAIDNNAFSAFGEEFTSTKYANMQNSYVTFSIPTTIKRIGANAFANCNGIKISLYDPNATYADYKSWDKTVVWEAGNAAARDCIWGFRPAIGWTRYSKVEIPDDYE